MRLFSLHPFRLPQFALLMLVKIPLETERTKHHSQFTTGPSATGRKSRRIRYNSQNTELFLPASKEIGRLPSRCTSIHSRPRHLAHTATSSCQSCNGPVLLYTLTYHLTRQESHNGRGSSQGIPCSDFALSYFRGQPNTRVHSESARHGGRE